MLDMEENQEVKNMPSKEMRKGSIVDLAKDLLAKANQVDSKSKKKITEWGDESEEDDDSQIGEKSERGKDLEVDKEKKVFLDALKSLNKDNMEHIPYYSGSLNGEELLDWLEAIDNQFDYKEVQEEKRINYAKARIKGFFVTKSCTLVQSFFYLRITLWNMETTSKLWDLNYEVESPEKANFLYY